MATIKRTNEEIRNSPSDIDWERVRATTEADIQRYIEEDGGAELDVSRAQTVVPPEYVLRIRKKLGLTRRAFAKRFGLSERTIEEWERGRQEPTGAARVLLRVIECEPEAVDRALQA